MLEGRRHVRYGVEGSANINPEGDIYQTIKAELVDICYAGIGVRADKDIRAGVCVSLKLIIKECDKPIVGTGRVKGSKEAKERGVNVFRIGIEFIDIDKDAIRLVISNVHRKSYVGPRKK